MDKNLNCELYKTVYRIRRAELGIQKYYHENEMKTPMHMSMGEEAIVAGSCAAMQETDQVLGTYRSHALYIAKCHETDAFFAELHGKENGIVRGKGGSMHLSNFDKGLLSCSAILSSNIPVAVGAALANKMKKNGKLVTVFFGDGAIDEGAFWESLNFACLKELPIIFICQDNNFAVHTSKEQRHGYKSILDVIQGFKCNYAESDSTDPEVYYNLVKDARGNIMKGSGPYFFNFKYYRYLEHVGIAEDFNAGYRDEGEFQDWYEKDPVKVQRLKLINAGFPEHELNSLEEVINQQIEKSISLSKEAPFADISEAYQGVFQ